MKLYIKQNLFSIINQSFQDFEIIIINDYSQDDTENIIITFQQKYNKIKLINHSQNLGVYHSRIEAILNSQGEYILLINYNFKRNLDIIEFTVFQQKEGEKRIFIPNNHYETHFHGFSKEIIFQPELSNLLFYLPRTKKYSKTICRNIWNKIIRRNIFIKVYEYLGRDYYETFVITADDMIMNIAAYQFAKNYSNIILPGYLYNIRKISMSRGEGGMKLKKIRTINHYQYFSLFYKYLQDFQKDRNFLMYEMKDLNHYILFIQDLNLKEYIIKQIQFLKILLKDKNIEKEFRKYITKTMSYFTI